MYKVSLRANVNVAFETLTMEQSWHRTGTLKKVSCGAAGGGQSKFGFKKQKQKGATGNMFSTTPFITTARTHALVKSQSFRIQ